MDIRAQPGQSDEQKQHAWRYFRGILAVIQRIADQTDAVAARDGDEADPISLTKH